MVSPVTGKTTIFTKGDLVSPAKLHKATCSKTPAWVEELAEDEAKIIRSNRSIDQANSADGNNALVLTPEEQAKIDEVKFALEFLGLDRSNFAFGRNVSLAFKDSTKEQLWVGVKINNPGDVLLRKDGKPVSLNLCNWISVDTFISRLHNNKSLFVD